MLNNYFKIAWRNLVKNKIYSIINIFGLTVGLSCCLLIGLYTQNEFSYDAFQEKGIRIARVIMEYSFDGSKESKRGNFTSTKVAPVFTRTFPEVKSAVRMTDADMIVRYRENLFTEHHFMFADSTFFDVFSYQLLQGSPSQALDGPHKVVMTESAAKKYFGAENPVGKILLTGTDAVAYEVTGVIKGYPGNSQIKFDFLASFSSLGANQEESYFDANYTTYLLLKDKNDFEPLQKKIAPFMSKEMSGLGASINYYLEPFDKIHLHSEYAGFVPNTNINYLYILSAVAALILIIVCFTYINLSTARSMERAREVGVRKVFGAGKFQLFWQFIGEAGVLCLIAILSSVISVMLVLPYFNNLTDKQLRTGVLFSPSFLIVILLTTVLVSLLAGSYPAIILSNFQPVKVLKGVFKRSISGKRLQSALIVFQFSISVFLVGATFIIQKQLYFIQHKNLGYDRDHILVLPMDKKILDNLTVIKQELKSNPNVLGVSRCVSTPVHIAGGYNMRTAIMPDNEQISVTANPIDEDYIKTAGLQIINGSDFSEQDMKDVAADKREARKYHFILNESAAKQLGWTSEEAVGKKMFLDNSRPGVVKAVIKDFHFESIHLGVKPLVLFTEIRNHGNLLVKINGQNPQKTIAFVEAKWKQIVPSMPFEYKFLDNDYEKLYRSELQLGKVMNLFTSLSIILACLGLFGLTSYVAQQRMKEIGVRKILGANVLSIFSLLSKDFIQLVLMAILIASPLAYFATHRWLQDFAYRTDLSWWVFAASGAGALVITLLTVSFQAVKAAIANPVKSLRTE